MIAVEALVPYARNTRTHSDAQIAQVAASISEFGFTNPVLIDGEQTGLRCYAMELSPQYVDVAVRRWQQFTGKTAVLESTGQPFPADLEKAA